MSSRPRGRAAAAARARGLARLGLVALLAAAPARAARQEAAEGLAVGHWVEAKGSLGARRDTFQAAELEVTRPEEEESLIGTVEAVDPDGAWLELLGQRVELSDKTGWRGELALERCLGERVKVEGYYRGPLKFSARTVSPRGAGRDRLAGRVDALRRTRAGLELDVMRWRVVLAPDGTVQHAEPLQDYPLLEPRGLTREEWQASERAELRRRDEDDDIPANIRLGPELWLGLRLELEHTDERDFDLNPDDDEDRVDDEVSVRGELVWTPRDDFWALLGFRHRWLWRDDEQDGFERTSDGRINEAFVYWRDAGGLPLDLQVGRQDFDEPREWLYDENLDAVRAIWRDHGLRLELSAATVLSDSSPRLEATDAYIAYLTNDDDDRTVGAYVIDTRTELEEDEYPFHFGLRAFGEWLPQNEVWAELGWVRGYEGDVDLRGWAYDLGTTWSPPALAPWYLTAGYAFGSGDDDPADGVDHAYRQTGLHDNNDKFGGVTSFRYYGELVEPELSNLGIWTLGVGRRFGRHHSVDLVWHRYRQDEAADRLRDTDLDRRPDGVHRDLGQELDLIVGSRPRPWVHLEFVLGVFEPGDAFPDDAATAYLGRVQLRFRF